jgi:hypothetical protein
MRFEKRVAKLLQQRVGCSYVVALTHVRDSVDARGTVATEEAVRRGDSLGLNVRSAERALEDYCRLQRMMKGSDEP